MAANDPYEAFSYASPDDPAIRRALIRAIEIATGQPYLKRLYIEYQNNPRQGESFFDAAVRFLRLELRYNEQRLMTAPRNGPLVVIANHPFGVLDGIALCHVATRLRPDMKVLTNGVLNRAPEIRDYILPVDFTETREALETNIESRAAAKRHLAGGGMLIVFPAGGVATTAKAWSRDALEFEWKNLTARLVLQAKAPVLPVYFPGQNSRLFQVASHIGMALRLSLLFHETRRRVGTAMPIRVGRLIPHDTLAALGDKTQIMAYLRAATFSLADDADGEGSNAKLRSALAGSDA